MRYTWCDQSTNLVLRHNKLPNLMEDSTEDREGNDTPESYRK